MKSQWEKDCEKNVHLKEKDILCKLPVRTSEWKIGDKHFAYGKVIAMGVRDGEPYRFFKSKDGVISLIPLPCLIEEAKW